MQDFESFEEKILFFGLEYAHIYLRNFVKNINLRNLPALFFLYLKDFSDDVKKTQSEIEFLRQTPFFAFSKEQEKKAVNFELLIKNYFFF